MKLKKIASLMLAGVMAVSMLAGCSNGTKPDDGEKDPVVDSSLTGKVIAALDEDTTKVVSFTSGSALDNAVAKLIQKNGTNNPGITEDALIALDEELGDTGLNDFKNNYNSDKSSAEAASKDATLISVIDTSSIPAGASQDYVVKKIAEAIDSKVDSLNMDDDSTIFNVDDEEFWYDYSYAGNLSVTELKDADTGAASYCVVINITRSAAKHVK